MKAYVTTKIAGDKQARKALFRITAVEEKEQNSVELDSPGGIKGFIFLLIIFLSGWVRGIPKTISVY